MTFEKRARLRYLNKMGMRISRSEARKHTRELKMVKKYAKQFWRNLHSRTAHREVQR